MVLPSVGFFAGVVGSWRHAPLWPWLVLLLSGAVFAAYYLIIAVDLAGAAAYVAARRPHARATAAALRWERGSAAVRALLGLPWLIWGGFGIARGG